MLVAKVGVAGWLTPEVVAGEIEVACEVDVLVVAAVLVDVLTVTEVICLGNGVYV